MSAKTSLKSSVRIGRQLRLELWLSAGALAWQVPSPGPVLSSPGREVKHSMQFVLGKLC